MLTGAVVTAVLKSLESGNQVVYDLLPGLGGQVVEIGEDSAHFGFDLVVVEVAG